MEKMMFWAWFIGLFSFIASFSFVLNRNDRVALFLCGLASGLWAFPLRAFLIRMDEIKKGIVYVDASKFEVGRSMLAGHFIFGLTTLVFVVIVVLVRYFKSQKGGADEEAKED